MTLALFASLLAALAWLGLSEPQRAAITASSESLIAMAIMGWLISSAVLALAAQRLFHDHVDVLAQLEEQTRIRVSGQTRQALVGAGGFEARALAAAISDLASARDHLLDDIDHQVRQASLGIERERRRLVFHCVDPRLKQRQH